MKHSAEVADLVTSLASTVERIEAATMHLDAAQLVASARVGEWSPNEVLWHIRASADVYGEHIARILDEHEPRWRHVSPRARMKKTRYDQLSFADSLAAFKEQRAQLVSRLEGLTPGAWERAALVRVAHRDSDWRLTLQERVRGMANHEEVHCAQLEATADAPA